MVTKKEFPEQVGVRLTREDLRELERLAGLEKRKVGQLCRIVIQEYIQKRRAQPASPAAA